MSLPSPSPPPPPPGAPTPPSPSPMHTLIACIKCGEPFTRAPRSEGGRRPLTLSCGHTYCEGCYESFSSPMPVPKCIFCGVESGAPVVDEALCEVVGAVQAAAAGRAAPPPCVECKSTLDEDTEATHVCKDCGDRNLCEDHGNVHLKKKRHVVEILGDAARPPTTCPTHLTPLNIFCMTDNTLVCGDCTLLEHRSHEVLSLTAAGEVLADRLYACMERCRVGGEALMRGMQTVLATKAGMVAATEATCETFGAGVQELVAIVKAEEASAKEKAKTLCKQREKAMDAQADELLVTSQQLGSVVALGNRALLDGHPVALYRAIGYGERAERLMREFEGVRSSAVVDISFALGGVWDAWENHSHVLRQAKEDEPIVETSISELSGILALSEARTKSVEADLQQRDSELVRMRNALGDKDAEVAGLHRDLARARNALSVKETEAAGLGRDLTLVKAALSNKETEAADLKRELAQMRTVLGDKTAEAAGVRRHLDKLISKATAECERVEAIEGVVPPDAIHFITGLSKTFRGVDAVALAFCEAVWNMCRDKPNAAVGREPVLTEVDTVLRLHKDSVATVTAGLLAVNNLICWDLEGMKAAAIRLGLIPFILSTMSRFPRDAGVVRSCLIVLRLLVTLPDGKAAISARNGVRLVQQARGKHRSNEDIQESSEDVLEALGVALD